MLGDYSARVGEPNVICDPDGAEAELQYVQRKSVDTKVDSFGRRVMATMNAIGLVLMNGIKERAEWTSFQRSGNAVVDFIWAPIESISKVERLKVWMDDQLQLGDHAMVSIDLRLDHRRSVEDKKDETQLEGAEHSPRKRWNPLSSSAVVRELQKACCHRLRGWSPGLAVSGDWDSGLDRVETIWKDWSSRVVAAAEEGLGYRVSKKPRPKGWDRVLANILQARNAARRVRNRCTGEDRKAAHGV